MTDSIYQRRILAALNYTGKHIFAGIDPEVRAKRRAKGKAAKAARKVARHG